MNTRKGLWALAHSARRLAPLPRLCGGLLTFRGPRTGGPIIRSLLFCIALWAGLTVQARAQDPAVNVLKDYVKEYVNGQGTAACGRLTDAAKQNLVQILAPQMPLTVIKTGNAGIDCPVFFNAAAQGLGPRKQTVLSTLSKVTFNVTPVTSTKRRAVMKNVEPEPAPVNLHLVNSAWKIHDGFQGAASAGSDPAMAPLPAGYACLGNKVCELVGQVQGVIQDAIGGVIVDPPANKCFGFDVAKLDPLKLQEKLQECLPQLCKGVPGIKNMNLTKPADDIDGDGLSNFVELLLKPKGNQAPKVDVCKRDTDGDGIPDGYDLVPGSNGVKGLKVNVAIVKISQDDALGSDKKIMDDGPFNGLGDPWIPDAVLTTGLLEENKGAKRIEFHRISQKGYITDPKPVINERFSLKGAPVTFSEDVREFPRTVSPRLTNGKLQPTPFALPPVPTSLPVIGLAAVFLDDDDGCDNEMYLLGEPDLDLCKGKSGLVPKYSTLGLLMELFGAGETLSNIASWGGKTAKEPLCVNTYGLQACFEVSVSDAKDKPLDPCALGIATASWKNLAKNVPVL